MHESLLDHLVATVRGRDISSNERFYRRVAAARLSRDFPIAGTGPNTFYENYKSFRVLKFKTWVSRNKEHSTTHNYFLFTLVEQGYIGLFFYSLFIWYLFYYTQRIYNRYTDKWHKTMIAALAGVFAAFLINNSLSEFLENDKIGGMFLIGIGLLIALDIRHQKSTRETLEHINHQESLL
jgi:O-antigen ligase